jgi:hypothetical protein
LGGESAGLADSCRAAARQASHRQGQSFLLLGLLLIFTFFVWLNLVLAMSQLPELLKTLFGVETAFTQAGWRGMLNTTYLACSFALAYVCVDPLLKAVFALRCFYGQSIQTADDLKSELARFRAPASASLAVLAVAAFFSLAGPVLALPLDAPPTTAISPEQLDQSIDEVLQRREFAWRMPREEAKDNDTESKSWFHRAVGSVLDTVRDAAKYCLNALWKSLKWIWKMILKLSPFSHSAEPDSGGGFSWPAALQFLLRIMIAVSVCILALLVLRLWNRRYRPQVVAAKAIAATPDLKDENVTADQLPEDEWLKLARELMAQGNFRLALRALYLAGLAHLAARELIAIAMFKSNRDYELEVLRRARALPEVQKAFSQNVAIFDRVWYGLHEVNLERVEEFRSNLERIRTC